MKNDGFHNLEYSLGDDTELNKQMSHLINEFCHVFRYHADGNWKSIYKPKYVEKMAHEIQQRPSLIRKLLKLNDPAVSNITYAVIEFNKKIRAKKIAHSPVCKLSRYPIFDRLCLIARLEIVGA